MFKLNKMKAIVTKSLTKTLAFGWTHRPTWVWIKTFSIAKIAARWSCTIPAACLNIFHRYPAQLSFYVGKAHFFSLHFLKFLN